MMPLTPLELHDIRLSGQNKNQVFDNPPDQMMEYQSTSFEKQRKKSTAFGNHGFSAVNF
jgi:hypothetical protein